MYKNEIKTRNYVLGNITEESFATLIYYRQCSKLYTARTVCSTAACDSVYVPSQPKVRQVPWLNQR